MKLSPELINKLTPDPVIPEREPNSFTRREYQESLGIGYETARNRIKKLAKDGVIVRTKNKIAIQDMSGRIQFLPGWKLADAKQ